MLEDYKNHIKFYCKIENMLWQQSKANEQQIYQESSQQHGQPVVHQMLGQPSSNMQLYKNIEGNGNRFVSNSTDLYEVLMIDEHFEAKKESLIDFHAESNPFSKSLRFDISDHMEVEHKPDMLADQMDITNATTMKSFASFKDLDQKNDCIEREKKPQKRKVRKTITQEVLDELNHMFTLYSQGRGSSSMEEGASSRDSDDSQALDLKKISKKLNLGYSTVLHKFSEFKGAKVVKGGVRINNPEKTRQYRKTLSMDEMIRDSLKERNFNTAVELSSYMKQRYQIHYPRAVLSRHLRIMNYSLSQNPSQYNKEAIKQARKSYLQQLISLLSQKDAKLYYIDQCEFSEADFMSTQMIRAKRQQNKSKVFGESRLFSTIALTTYEKGIIKYKTKDGRYNGEDFVYFLQQMITDIYLEEKISPQIIVFDLKEAHRTQKIAKMRYECKASNIFFLYTPPMSEELNLTNHLFYKVKKMIKNNHQQTIAMKREILNESLGSFQYRYLDIQTDEMKNITKKALLGKDLE